MENLEPSVKAQYDKYKEKINSLASKLKATVEQGRLIAGDPSQLFLFKGMYIDHRSNYDAFNSTWEKITDLFFNIGQPSLFPSKNEKSLLQAVERYYIEGNAIYAQYMNPTPVGPGACLNPGPAAGNGTLLNESRTVRARLPQINLPDFSGSAKDWPLFRDTYKALIHDEATLSGMEKFLFLVSCLKGPAKSLISNISLTEQNYEQAWNVLTEHYNDRRRLAYSYLKQILDFKPLTGRPTAASLKNLITSVIEQIESFNHLGIENKEDFLLSFLVLRCLDSSMKMSFEKKYSDVDFPTYKNLVDFIKVEWKSMEIMYNESDQSSQGQSSTSRSQSFPNFNNRSKNSLFVESHTTEKQRSFKRPEFKGKGSNNMCPVCKSTHSLYQCRRFRDASADEKHSLLKNWVGCRNCLSAKHSTNQCPSMRRCSACNLPHHSWLHQQQERKPNSSPENQSSNPTGITLGSVSTKGEVILGTALIQVLDIKDSFQNIRAVVDSGSQFSFMTSSCAQKLGLVIEPCKQAISGIGQVHLSSTVGSLRCTLRSTISSFSSKQLSTEVIVVPRITSDLPRTELPLSIKANFMGYALADPQFWKPGVVDFLLGGDLFFDILTGTPIKIKEEIPRLLPTIFGFIIGGPLQSQPKSQISSSFLIQSGDDLRTIMNKFWEVEEPTTVHSCSEEDDYCESHFQSTHYRLDSGRYVVSLPTKESISTLENTRGQAFKRLVNLESKLQKNINLKREYHQFMKEYMDLGHMKPVSSGTAAYTLPHHAVIKIQDQNIKLRTVFDASCRSSKGSLNDHLYVGPKLQLDIRDLLINFRTHKVVLTADIVKMYRQIELHPSDRRYQHILWRFDPSEAVQEYQLCTVTYGVSSAPFHALRTIRQLVDDEGSNYPLASKALLEDIYVDDIVTGAATIEDAKQLQTELVELLGRGCFQLSKWASNKIDLLQSLDETQCQVSAVRLSSEDEPRIKLLGMQWIPLYDCFTYEITIPSWNSSKRSILSGIAHIYDPIGFLSPVVFYAKTILQETWITKCNWDDPTPPDISRKWHKFLSELGSLSEIRIPRCIIADNTTLSSIVGFSDASQKGYSAVLYLLTHTTKGCNAQLLKAKTKLAPIKPMTVPRLELSGAVLLSCLYDSCKRLIEKLNVKKAHFFTDSSVVLGWLQTPPQNLKTFVAHRVVQILEMTMISQWNHVRSEQNPADCSSRGTLPSGIINNTLWWAGPHWLTLPQDEWPHSDVLVDHLPELKPSKGANLAAVGSVSSGIMNWMERFSSYSKLLHSMVYIQRFINRLKKKEFRHGPITFEEMRLARRTCIKIVQAHQKIDAKHLRSLRSFIGEDGLLRVGGRLDQSSSLNYDAKHPAILSSKTHFVKLLVDHFHVSYLHLSPTALQAMLQSKYWIVSARQLIRQRVFNCIKCYKANKVPNPPIMGSLPSYRLEQGQIFNHVGVDFGGPFYIKESSRRKAARGKAYLCLFVCMVTKAVHLEVVSDCTTKAFLAAFDRFVARRGKPAHMYSDCGTNFVGAANKMKEILLWQKTQQTQDEISRHVAPHDISWSFNPPNSPHFGGIWEAGIKSAKAILRKVVDETPLTFEELSTLFCRIEGILNSRPLTPISSDPDCLESLTPGHFLIGRALIAPPEQDNLKNTITFLKRWDMIKRRTQHFWSRWRSEYLHQLQQRKKWITEQKNLKIGDMVIIKDPSSPVKTWPLARVVATHPGHDGVVRVVTIRTSSGEYKRPVAKLVPLSPINDLN